MTNSTRCALLAKQACTTLSHVVQKITPPSANNFLKLFFALFAMLALGVGNAWGETVTFTPSNCTNWTSSQAEQTQTIDGITLHSTGAANNTQLRLYSGATHTFTSTVGNITSILFTCTANGTANYGPGKMSGDGYVAGTGKTGEWTGNSAEVTLTGGQSRCTSIVVTYTPSSGGGDTPDPTTYTIKWHTAKGVTTDVTLNEGAAITKPETDPTMTGYEFMGWTEDCEVASDGTGFTAIEDFGTATEDKDYYAVFAVATTTGGGGGSTTGSKTLVSYSESSYYTEGAITGALGTNSASWTADGFTMVQNKNSGTAVSLTYAEIRVYASHSIVFTPTSGSTITSIVATATTNAYASALGGSSVENCTKSVSSSTVTITPTDGTEAVTLTNTAQSRLKTIVVNYTTSGGGTTTYDNYITTCSGSTETVASLTVNPTTIDFGTVYEGATVADQTVAVNFENLNGNVTYSGLSTPFSATGNISTTGDKITISADASTIGEYSQTLTVASTADSKTAEVTVKMNVVAAPAPTGTFELYSGELTEGDYVIYYNGSAMKAEVASSRLSYVEVAPTDNKIENPDAATIWHIAQSGTNWTIYNNDKGYAAGTGTANKAQLLSQEDITTGASASDNLKKASWTVTGTETYDFVNVFNSTKDSPVNANLRNNVSGGTNYGFACYATNTGGALTLYKKSDGKQAAGLAYATDKYLVKFGDEFTAPELTNPKTLTVTYGSSNEDVATVDATTGAITVKAVGYATITASFGGTEEIREGSAKYTLCVTEHAGTQADPYSVADARRVIDVMETAEGVYATGIVSEIVTAYNSNYGNISYNISADGLTTSDQLQAYRGKSYDGANFTSADDVKVGDEVVIKGTLKKFSTTYEFDENNQLVSLNRTKEQAGLAYAVTELAAEVGATDFAEPELTNPNNLTVTYSSSNSTLATVNATTGEVTILAAGKVTITASTAGDATYAAGSASYNITITDPSLAVATLPFTFNSGKADIENTAGMSQTGLGDDYNSAPKLRFNGKDDNVIVHFDSQAGEFSFLLKQNGSNAGTFTVYESANGEDYTSVWSGGNIGNTKSETITPTLAESSRYVKFEYTTKGEDTNYALGSISIAKPDTREEASLAWDPSSVTLTQGDAFTAPTLQNPKSVAGITYESSNDEVATVTAEGEIALASAIGTATITATFGGDATYKPAKVTCVIKVNEYIETIDGKWQLVTDASKLQIGMEIIIASVADADGTIKTMGAQNNNNRSEVSSTVSGDMLNPAEGTKVITLEDCQLYEGLFALKTEDGYLYAASSSSNHLKSQEGINDNACWTITVTEGVASVVATNSSNHNVMRYNKNSDLFSCYEENNNQQDIAIYAKVPDCTREIPVGYYGTVCLPSNIIKVLGATLYEVAGKEDNGRVVFDEVLAPEAGMPYIFLSHNAEVLFFCGDQTADEAGKHNSLQGTFTQIDPAVDNILVGNYMVVNNVIKKCGINCGLQANRAYFTTELESLGTAPALMPGRRRVSMGVTGENGTTDLDNITSTDTPVKVIENGQLIIIRDGVKYNVQGVRL